MVPWVLNPYLPQESGHKGRKQHAAQQDSVRRVDGNSGLAPILANLRNQHIAAAIYQRLLPGGTGAKHILRPQLALFHEQPAEEPAGDDTVSGAS